MAAGYFLWSGEKALPITAREADRHHRDTDAGIDDRFVVVANCWCEAERGARMWIANRADETVDMVPDGVGLYEREYRLGKTYMVLTVDFGECRGCKAVRRYAASLIPAPWPVETAAKVCPVFRGPAITGSAE